MKPTLQEIDFMLDILKRAPFQGTEAAHLLISWEANLLIERKRLMESALREKLEELSEKENG